MYTRAVEVGASEQPLIQNVKKRRDLILITLESELYTTGDLEEEEVFLSG